MSFKDMKRDDHGHVISNNEQDGQKCQHGSGGSHKYGKDTQGRHYVEDNKGYRQFFAKEEEAKNYADRMNASNPESFDDDYDEEFNEGGVAGDLQKAGFENINIVNEKTLTFEGPDTKTWTIKENENAGFDVYNSEGKKVINDFNAVRGNIATAILQNEQKNELPNIEDFDKDGEEDISDEEQKQIDKSLSDARNRMDKTVSDFLEGRKITENDFKQIQKEMQEKLGYAADDTALLRYMNKSDFDNDKVKIGTKEMTVDEWKEWANNNKDKEMAREFMLNHASEFNMSENQMEDFLADESQEEYLERVKPETNKFMKNMEAAGYELDKEHYGVKKKESENNSSLNEKQLKQVNDTRSRLKNLYKNKNIDDLSDDDVLKISKLLKVADKIIRTGGANTAGHSLDKYNNIFREIRNVIDDED